MADGKKRASGAAVAGVVIASILGGMAVAGGVVLAIPKSRKWFMGKLNGSAQG